MVRGTLIFFFSYSVTGEIVRSVLTTERRPMARVRVSSHHLLQVSHVFRLMIQNARQEGKLLSADEETSSILALQKPLDIPLLPREGRDGEEDPDPEVFVLVMSIVHLRSSSIPRVVSLDMLTRVAVVVERFALHEAVGFVTQTWIEHLLKGGGYDGSRVESRGTEAEEEQIPSFAALPSEVNGDLVRWMFVATVFGLDEVLRCLENVAATGARSRLDYWNFPRLPVPEGLVGTSSLSSTEFEPAPFLWRIFPVPLFPIPAGGSLLRACSQTFPSPHLLIIHTANFIVNTTHQRGYCKGLSVMVCENIFTTDHRVLPNRDNSATCSQQLSQLKNPSLHPPSLKNVISSPYFAKTLRFPPSPCLKACIRSPHLPPPRIPNPTMEDFVAPIVYIVLVATFLSRAA